MFPFVLSSAFSRTISVVCSVCIAAVAVAQDEQVAGDLDVEGQTLTHGDWHQHVLNNLSGRGPNPATDSRRYEIGRIFVNTHHWQSTSPIVVELRQSYYQGNGYLKFLVSAGYQDFDGSVTLLERYGDALYANVHLGAPVLTGGSSGGFDNQYIPLYADFGFYTYWDVRLSHNMRLTDDPLDTSRACFYFNESPTPVDLLSFKPSPHGSDHLSKHRLYTGSMGIATENVGTHKLAVGGTIRAEELVVDTGWADYVFEDGYELRSLGDVEAHIEEHGHLPGVPSAADVAETGVSVGDSQRILLEKVEELTLYVIEQQRQLQKQNQRLEDQVKEIRMLKERLLNDVE